MKKTIRSGTAKTAFRRMNMNFLTRHPVRDMPPREPEPEYEEYERHTRRDEERLRREREAEQPDVAPADELEFSMNDVPRGRRRRRRRHRDAGHGCLVGAMYTAFVLGVSMFLAALVIIAANEVFAFVKAGPQRRDRAGRGRHGVRGGGAFEGRGHYRVSVAFQVLLLGVRRDL